MKVPKEYYDEIFNYLGQWDQPCACGLKIRRHEGKTYVVVTELYQENPEGIDFNDMAYIECAPDTNSKLSFYDEEYYEVDFSADILHKYHQLDPKKVKAILDA